MVSFKMKQAAKEIQAVLMKYDVNGYVILSADAIEELQEVVDKTIIDLYLEDKPKH